MSEAQTTFRRSAFTWLRSLMMMGEENTTERDGEREREIQKKVLNFTETTRLRQEMNSTR